MAGRSHSSAPGLGRDAQGRRIWIRGALDAYGAARVDTEHLLQSRTVAFYGVRHSLGDGLRPYDICAAQVHRCAESNQTLCRRSPSREGPIVAQDQGLVSRASRCAESVCLVDARLPALVGLELVSGCGCGEGIICDASARIVTMKSMSE